MGGDLIPPFGIGLGEVHDHPAFAVDPGAFGVRVDDFLLIVEGVGDEVGIVFAF